MSKKISKTTEELTEEFFAAERLEYEKRVPEAFPRVEAKALSEVAGIEESPADATPDIEIRKSKEKA
jgi:hypothetical protein